MGFLDGFARGAAGAGMLKVGEELNQRDREERQRQEREAAIANHQAFQVAMAKLHVELKGVEREQEDAFKQKNKVRDLNDEVEAIKVKGGALNAVGLAGAIAAASNPELIDAQRKKAAGDAAAAAQTARETVKANAADQTFIKANWDVSMSDPRIKAAYASAMASAGASGAQSRLAGEQFNQLVQAGSVATKVRALQSQLAQATDQPAREAIQQQISDLGFAGKDPSKFLALAEKAQDNIVAAMKIAMDPTASAEDKAAAKGQIQRATELSTKAAAMGGIKMETPTRADPPAAAIEHLRKNPGLAADFDAYYGKGLAAKVLSTAPAASLPVKKAAGGTLALPGADRTPDSSEAGALDAARQAEAAANEKLRKFGSVQQQRDPTGYREAVGALAAARDARMRAEAAYQATIPGAGGGAAFRYPGP